MPGGRKRGPIALGQNPGGRPEAEIDLKELEKLCAIQCTNAEIAAWFGVSERTIDRKRHEPEFLDVMERGKGKGRISVRRLQMKAAEAGNPALLIWLGKQVLGQRDLEREAQRDMADRPTRVTAGWVTPKPVEKDVNISQQDEQRPDVRLQ